MFLKTDFFSIALHIQVKGGVPQFYKGGGGVVSVCGLEKKGKEREGEEKDRQKREGKGKAKKREGEGVFSCWAL